jgi:hemerythrin-like domain-containing protein
LQPSVTDVCEYCGCQAIEVIADLTAEHDRLRELSRDLSDAARSADLRAARMLTDAMRAILGPHTAVEESGLFPALAGEFPEQIAVLSGEHRAVDAVLASLADDVPPSDWAGRVLAALGQLFEHILKEQDGVFPAALGVLDGEEWERIEDLRAHVGSGLTAHPEQHDHHHEHGSGRAAAAPSGRTPR